MFSVRVLTTRFTSPLMYSVSAPEPPAYVTTMCVQAFGIGMYPLVPVDDVVDAVNVDTAYAMSQV